MLGVCLSLEIRQTGVLVALMSRKFVGIGRIGNPPVLVARFLVALTGQSYYMTLEELCDWIENQMASGFYYTARKAIAVDREGLMTLIEAQRKLLAGRIVAEKFPLITGGETPFTEFVKVAPESILPAAKEA